ncbi:MAG: TonB family protein [Nitrospirae bacterium]|nr:TonB family protein [Nitrospirota bacterium]
MSKSDSFAFAVISIVIHLCASVFITGYYGPSGSGTSREKFIEVGVVQTKPAEPPAPADEVQPEAGKVAVPEPDAIPVAEETPAEPVAETPPVPEAAEPAQAAAGPEAGSSAEQPFGIALPLECQRPHSGFHVRNLYRSPYMEELGATGEDMLDDVPMINFGEVNGPAIASFYEPEYPPLAAMYGMQGRVILRVFLDSYGNIQEVLVLESAGSVLDEAAVMAAANSLYHPARDGGMPISCYSLLPVNFELGQFNN